MSEPTKSETTKTSKLDLWSKGFYPALALVVAIFGMCWIQGNNDNKRQIDELKQRLTAAEKKQEEMAQQAEDPRA